MLLKYLNSGFISIQTLLSDVVIEVTMGTQNGHNDFEFGAQLQSSHMCDVTVDKPYVIVDKCWFQLIANISVNGNLHKNETIDENQFRF